MRAALWLGVAILLASSACKRPEPEPTPRHWATGTMKGARYHAADGSFTCEPPHAVDTAEFAGSVLRDGQDSDAAGAVTYVTFGPGPTDPAGYHVVLASALAGRPDLRPLAERAEQVVAHYMATYDGELGGSGERLVFRHATVAGRPAIYAVYRYDYQQDGVPALFYTAFAIIRSSDTHVVNVMAERLTLENPWYPGIDVLSVGEWERFTGFAASVEVAD